MNIYKVNKVLKDDNSKECEFVILQVIVIADIDEDLMTCEMNHMTNELYVAGEFGIIYSTQLHQETKHKVRKLS